MRVGILGLGLMGGSLALALRSYMSSVQIAAVQREDPDLIKAKKAGVIDKVFSTLEELVLFADLIILSPPLSEIVPLAKAIAQEAKKRENRLLVLDIGSVKGAITLAFEHYSDEHVEFLSTHPMAGSENTGSAGASSLLFQKAPWIVVPHPKNNAQTLREIHAWIEKLGGSPIEMDAKTHDAKVALISHFPALLSRLLKYFVQNTDSESLQIAGPGFASMTRLAKEPKERFEAMVKANRENIELCLEQWITFLEKQRHTL